MTKSVFTGAYDYFRALLIDARRATGLTQAALARQMGRPQSFVSKYERGERRLDVLELLDVADALDIDVADLLAKLGSSRRLKPQTRRRP